MATYYVAQTGLDTNAGTKVAPFLNHPESNLATSASLALRSTLAAGDTVVLRKGDIWHNTQLTTARNGSNGSPIITTIEDGFDIDPLSEAPIIRAATLLNGTWSNVSGDIYRIALTTACNLVYDAFDILAHSDGGYAALTIGQWDHEAGYLYVNIGINPTGGNILASQRDALSIGHSYRNYDYVDLDFANSTSGAPLYFTAGSGSEVKRSRVTRGNVRGCRILACNDINIETCTIVGRSSADVGVVASGDGTNLSIIDSDISGFASYGIYNMGQTSGLIDGNTIHDCGNYGMFLASASSNVEVSNNRIYDIPNDGIRINAGDGLKVHHNTIQKCWDGLLYNTGKGDGIYLNGQTVNCDFYSNFIEDCYGGINVSCYAGYAGNDFWFNVVKHSKVNGIAEYAGSHAGASNRYMYNTIIHRPIKGLDAAYHGHGFSLRWTGEYAEFRYNTVYIDSLTEGTGRVDVSLFVPAGTYSYTINNNYYYEAVTDQAGFNYDGTSGQTFEQWKAALALDAGVIGGDADSSFADPKFRNSDGQIQADSPCINAGPHVAGLTDTGINDYWGNYVYRLPNIGADQGAGSPGSIQIVFEVES